MNDAIEQDKKQLEFFFSRIIEISEEYGISNNDIHELEEVKRHVIKKMNRKMKTNLQEAIKELSK
jgi:hypothetical protein